MAEQYVPNLGQTPTDDARRDAVHVAVAPVVAACDLPAGAHVGFVAWNRTLVGWSDENVGVVDPFRAGGVEKGERFWLFLFPGTITGLRHVWTHPAFAVRPPVVEDTADERR